MPGTIHYVELFEKLKAESHLIIPPLKWNAVTISSALHLCHIMKTLGKEAYILGHHSWKNHFPEEWPDDHFILLESNEITLGKRPDWVWLWGFSKLKDHSPFLKDFLIGCDSIQVLDWRQSKSRNFGDFIYHTPLLGGLAELSYTFTTELEKDISNNHLALAMETIVNDYTFLTRDAPLIHMLNQLHPPRHIQSTPEVEPASIIESGDWKIIVYSELNEQLIERLRRKSLDIHARSMAEHVLFVYESEASLVEFNIVTPRMDFELHLRQNLIDSYPQNLDGRFKLDDLDSLIPLLPEKGQVCEKLKLIPWPKGHLDAQSFKILCDDPAWEFERERKFEESRVLEETAPVETEESPTEELPKIHWDASELIRRVRALNEQQVKKKPPRLILTYHDLKEVQEKILKSRARELDDAWLEHESENEKLNQCADTRSMLQQRHLIRQSKLEELERSWLENIELEKQKRQQEQDELLKQLEEEKKIHDEEEDLKEFLNIESTPDTISQPSQIQEEKTLDQETADQSTTETPPDEALNEFLSIENDTQNIHADVEPEKDLIEYPDAFKETTNETDVSEQLEDEQASKEFLSLENDANAIHTESIQPEEIKIIHEESETVSERDLVENSDPINETTDETNAPERLEEDQAVKEFLSIENDVNAIHIEKHQAEEEALEAEPETSHAEEELKTVHEKSEEELEDEAALNEFFELDNKKIEDWESDYLHSDQEGWSHTSAEDGDHHASPVDSIQNENGESDVVEFPTYEQFMDAVNHSESEMLLEQEAELKPTTAAVEEELLPETEDPTPDPDLISEEQASVHQETDEATGTSAHLQPVEIGGPQALQELSEEDDFEVQHHNFLGRARTIEIKEDIPEKINVIEDKPVENATPNWNSQHVEQDILDALRSKVRLRRSDWIYLSGLLILITYIFLSRS